MDVLPDVQLGPVANRKHTDALTPVDPAVVEVPELRSLVLRIPSVVPVPKTEHPLLGPGPFLVAPGTSERRIKATGVQRLAQGHSLHDVGVVPRPVVEWVDAFSYTDGVGMDDQVQS